MTTHPEETTAFRVAWPRLEAFLASIRATRDLSEYVAAKSSELNDVEAMIVRSAVRLYPGVPIETHRAVAVVVHREVHRRQTLLEGATGNDQERAALDAQWTADMKQKLLDITGDPDDYWRYAKAWNAIGNKSNAKILRGSLLIGAVSDFEVLVAGLVRGFLQVKPEILRGSDRKFTFNDLEPFVTLEEVREHSAELMAETLLRGGFDDWMKWFQRQGIEVDGVTSKNSKIIEIFQRRHLFVHNGGIVNRSYLGLVTAESRLPELGARLTVSSGYLASALDELTLAGMKLTFALISKLQGDESDREHVSHHVNELVYEALTAGWFDIAHRLSEWHRADVAGDGNRLQLKVNQWIAVKSLNGIEEIQEEVAAWDTGTLSWRYRLAKMALLDNAEEAYDLIVKVIRRGDMPLAAWRDWPLLEAVRQYEVDNVSESERIRFSPFGWVTHAGESDDLHS